MLKSKALQSLLHCLEGSPNTSVSSGWKNLNYDSLVGGFLPSPHQLGNDLIMLKKGPLATSLLKKYLYANSYSTQSPWFTASVSVQSVDTLVQKKFLYNKWLLIFYKY